MVEKFRLALLSHYATLNAAIAALRELSIRLHEDAAGLTKEAQRQRDPEHRKRAEELAMRERARAELYGSAAVQLEKDMKKGTTDLDTAILKRVGVADKNGRRRG